MRALKFEVLQARRTKITDSDWIYDVIVGALTASSSHIEANNPGQWLASVMLLQDNIDRCCIKNKSPEESNGRGRLCGLCTLMRSTNYLIRFFLQRTYFNSNPNNNILVRRFVNTLISTCICRSVASRYYLAWHHVLCLMICDARWMPQKWLVKAGWLAAVLFIGLAPTPSIFMNLTSCPCSQQP